MSIGILEGKGGPFKIDILIIPLLLLQHIEWYCSLTHVNMPL